jgi:hypothetical protein
MQTSPVAPQTHTKPLRPPPLPHHHHAHEAPLSHPPPPPNTHTHTLSCRCLHGLLLVSRVTTSPPLDLAPLPVGQGEPASTSRTTISSLPHDAAVCRYREGLVYVSEGGEGVRGYHERRPRWCLWDACCAVLCCAELACAAATCPTLQQHVGTRKGHDMRLLLLLTTTVTQQTHMAQTTIQKVPQRGPCQVCSIARCSKRQDHY